MLHKRMSFLLSMLVVLSLLLTACGGAAEPAAPAAEAPAEEAAAEEPAEEAAAEEAAPTEEPAEEAAAEEAPAEEAAAETAGGDYLNATRAETVIFDIDGGRVTDPELWNPFVPGNRRDHGYHQAILEPLFILNYQTGEFIPWLAESFEANETQDVWTLNLREGVKWQDGEDFNADDVIFTMNMLLENSPELGDSASQADWVASVEKVDDLTVNFNLTRPNPRYQLDYWSVKIWGGISIMPEHVWAGQDPLTFKYYDPEQGWPMGTGPYKLASVSPTEFAYVRDDNWWGAQAGFMDLPAPKKLIWTWAGPEETRAALMADGQLDSLMDITLGALQALQAANPNVITWFSDMPAAWVPDPCSRTFEFNHTVEPWNSAEMRWALNYAMDRDQIVEIAYEGTTLKSRHFFPAYPPLDALVDKAIEAGTYNLDQLWTYDPAKAKELIEGQGYTLNANNYYEKDGKELSIDITTHEAFIEKQRIAQVLVEQFQAVGINATTRNEAGGTWGENFNLGNFEARMGWQTCGSVNEPWNSLDTFNVQWNMPVGERANRNQWRWSGEAADQFSALVDEMGTLPLGDPQVEELFVEAMGIWFAELPVIPVTQAKKIIPFDTTYWTGWPTFDNDYIHPPTWWQHTHVIIHNLEPTGAQ
jgi:peptide/nickel transport system substrate-binding protein